MGKYVLLAALAIFAWWLWRRAGRRPPPAPPPERPVESMVRCAHCGVNQPRSESLAVGDRYYCSPAHRRLREGG